MKAAFEKCVELRISTTEYRHYLPDLCPEFELDVSNMDVPKDQWTWSEDVKTLLELNQSYQDQLTQARNDISGLVGQMTQLTLAVNTSTTGEQAGPCTPVTACVRGQATFRSHGC